MIWVKKSENEMGWYANAKGIRYSVEWCVGIVGSTPEAEGYERHANIQAACEVWGLTVWVAPEAETEFQPLTKETTDNE